VKTKIALALALTAVLCAHQPVFAADSSIEEIVRKNCTKELVSVTEVTRDELKKFKITKKGSGYLMSGVASSGRTLKCETNSEGRVIKSSFS
jgi:hypothetical protein